MSRRRGIVSQLANAITVSLPKRDRLTMGDSFDKLRKIASTLAFNRKWPWRLCAVRQSST
jgi:hypothetical protein